MKIRKAIIPAAGLGTRFLPATKAQPKEMLPVVDKPTIQYIVEEAIQSGIEDIIIISGRGKRSIEDHFDTSYELEETLLKKGKIAELKEMQAISSLANIHYIRQREPKGLGHAILCAKSFIGDEPFAVLLGDDIIQGDVPCIKQLIEKYEKQQSAIVGIQEVPQNDVTKYGMLISPEKMEDRLYSFNGVIEKPKLEHSPSNFAVLGRYILTPEIFSILERIPFGVGNELQLTDAIHELRQGQSVYGYVFEGKRYDVGDKLGFIKATLDFALQREELRADVLQFINEIKETCKG
ncbi:UTP--glucose-1-phosphate uridylyltransferase GalU [Evansella sp. AB-rgal1]|uniref:UTP--glucose-1-phosphate uridylyltransferase GalU n=1 Tax=Evansella sp. AB-rgal1 TaxID=3242696 RepID=UPI00359D68FA